ncbi:M36 family metallopeptidase [Flavobacterium sp. J27]|uniref:M36 family metallopeptidase n=1 Tax=Flavobacterium sp. J27 TaxID=2060419 RepID=UPI001030199E|nr:M36 family metallopeptidase [Flavobacterium sp. J27]
MKNIYLSIMLIICCVFYTNLYAQEKNIIQTELERLVEQGILNEQDILNWNITDQYTSRNSSIRHIYFRQVVNGLEIINTESDIHILPTGDVLTFNYKFTKDISSKVLSRSISSTSALQAVKAASNQLGYKITENFYVVKEDNSSNKKTLVSNGGVSLSDIPVQLNYFLSDSGEIELVWNLSIEAISQQEWYNVLVHHATGEILAKFNWVVSCNFDHDHSENDCQVHNFHNEKQQFSLFKNTNSFSSTLLNGTYNVFAMPLESPYYGSRSIVTNTANVASPFGWHDTNGVSGVEYTVTRGNNVNAYEDGDNPGFQPNGGTSLNFNFPFNPTYSNSNQSEAAAITNLFYWNNIIHDLMYVYGFDETSGNFQSNNYGNGGLGNDFVKAEAQDGSGTCNANFATPSDGSSPRMQMYVCGTQDGDFDNLVIVHEYGHGISNRLTGGPSNSSCLMNQEQMGEGWSDYYGLLMTMTSANSSTSSRTVGTYLFNQGPNGAGIRPFPYNTSMTINPQTYDSIKTVSGPHAIGSVWCTMLWEMTWNLINQHGFDADLINGNGGNNISLALVTEGLKLQPCSPGFVDARNAILAADIALYGGANQCAIWTAFAKRGLGYSASQGSSFDKNDGTQAFDLPSTCNCDIALNVMLNVNFGVDTKQASSTINASNTINAGAMGIYHAGNEVLLSNGFTSINGSAFRAYIEGCTNIYVARQVNPSIHEEYNYEVQSVETETLKEQLKIAPNPNNGVFKLLFKTDTVGEIEIMDLYGLTIYKSILKNQKEAAIDIQNSPRGIYILKVKTNTGLDIIEKIVKE